MLARGFVAGAVLFAAAGCSANPTHEEIGRRQSAAYREMADILAGVKDADGMAAAHARLENMQESLAGLIRQAKNLGPPGKEALVELTRERGKMQESLRRVVAELRRIRDLPGGEEFVKSLSLETSR